MMYMLYGYKNMAKEDQICCAHIFTASAVVGVLQFVLIMICLSTSGIVLDHWQSWKTDFQRNRDLYMAMPKRPSSSSTSTVTGVFLFPTTRASGTTQYTSTTTSPSIQYPVRADNMWIQDVGLETFVQIHLAHHIAIYATWLMFLALYAAAFRSMRPILVLPNLIMQLISLIVIIILAGTLIARLVKLYRQYQLASSLNDDGQMDDIHMRYAFHAVLLGCLVIVWFVECMFAIVGYRFYIYLRDQMRNMYPEIPVITFPLQIPERRISSANRTTTVNGAGEIMMTTNIA